MKSTLYTIDGAVSNDNYQIDDSVFAVAPNHDVIHQSVKVFQSNQRTKSAHAKDRAEVRGGGRKPWRQKGTGRARAGSTRSPLWIGGGKSFGPRNEKSYKGVMPKKMRRIALSGALSAKLASNTMFVVESLPLKEAKTKQAHELLAGFIKKQGFEGSFEKANVLVVLDAADESRMNLKRATKNLPNVTVTAVDSLHPYLLLTNQYVIIVKQAIDALHERFGVSNDSAKKAS